MSTWSQVLGKISQLKCIRAVQRAIAYPRAWMVLEGEVRRSLVRRFPYGVVYSEDGDGILIVAVMHLHRGPGYWKERV